MRRTSLSIAAGLTAVLLVSGTPAQAAVSAKDLPKKGDIVITDDQQPRPDTPLYVTVQQDLSVWVGEEQVAHIDMRAALDGFTEGDRETRVFLRADRTVSYGDLMTVMNLLRAGGFTQIGLVGLEVVP